MKPELIIMCQWIRMRSVYLPRRDAAASEAQLVGITLRRQQPALAIYSNDEITPEGLSQSGTSIVQWFRATAFKMLPAPILRESVSRQETFCPRTLKFANDSGHRGRRGSIINETCVNRP